MRDLLQNYSVKALNKYARSELIKRQTEEAEKAAEKAKVSFYAFLRQCWPYIPQCFEYIDNWHIQSICAFLEAVHRQEIQRGVINIPPGHAKSVIISVAFPAWKWALDPSWSMLCASYEANLTKRDNLRTISILESDWYQKNFVKGAWQLTKKSESWVQNDKGGLRFTTSVGGAGTGWRAHTILIDDPLNSIDARSEAARKEAIYWLDKAISSRLVDPRTGQIVLVMQRLHEDDPTGHVLRQGLYEHLCLPSEFEPKRKTVVYIRKPGGEKTELKVTDPHDGKTYDLDRRTEKGELLFPALYTREVLEQQKRTMGSDGYAGQHQQRPTPTEGGLFKKKFWRFWKPDGYSPEESFGRPEGCYEGPARALPDRFDQVVLSLDATFKDGAKNDFVCFLVIGVRGADRFVLDRMHGRMSFTKTLAMFRILSSKWPLARRKLVEDKANGSAIIDTLRSEIPGIIAVNPEGGKESRAAAIQPQVESGNVYLPDGASWLDSFIEEFAAFPNGSHDDQVDALSQALIYLSASPALARAIAMSRA